VFCRTLFVPFLGYLFEKETPIHTNEVYSHGVGTSEDAIALSSIICLTIDDR
jgi:hypothetical protein